MGLYGEPEISSQARLPRAVEQQTATTNEISGNIREAAKGSAEIAKNTARVASAAQSTTQGAHGADLAEVAST